MKRLALIVSLLLIPNSVQSSQTDQEPVCFADKYGVRRHSPDAWPAWTRNMPGHRHEKCWYPAASRYDKKWRSAHTKDSVKESRAEKHVTENAVKKETHVKSYEVVYRIGNELYRPYAVPKGNTFNERFEAAYTK